MNDASRKETREPKVSIVVPVHNGAEYTRCFLSSLAKVDYPCFDLTVIDDGSTDETPELLRGEYPFKINVIRGDGSFWWTRSVNSGVEESLKAGAEYILTLNNDVVVEPDFIKYLVRCSQEEGGAIVGPKILFIHEPSKVWSACGRILWYSGKLFYTTDKGKTDSSAYSKRRTVEFVHGMGALVPAQVFSAVGMYDEEHYPQYHGDVEFSLRAAKAGFKVMVEPGSVIYNDAEHSRAVEIRKKINMITPLFEPHSPYNLKMNWRLYRDYAPGAVSRYLGFFIKYMRYFAGTIRYITAAVKP